MSRNANSAKNDCAAFSYSLKISRSHVNALVVINYQFVGKTCVKSVDNKRTNT